MLEDVFVCYANGISGADVESLSLDYQARPGCERGRDTDLGEGKRERDMGDKSKESRERDRADLEHDKPLSIKPKP